MVEQQKSSNETIVGGNKGGPAQQGLACTFDNDAAAEMHAAATSGQQGRAQPAIPVVHLAPLGTGVDGRMCQAMLLSLTPLYPKTQ